MSTNAYWRPEKPSKGRDLCDGIKWALRKRQGGHIGLEGFVLSVEDVPWLEGVRDATFNPDDEMARDADVLIAAIQEHGAVRVWCE